MVAIVIITIIIRESQLTISGYRKIQVVLKIRPCLPMRLFFHPFTLRIAGRGSKAVGFRSLMVRPQRYIQHDLG